MLAMHVIKRARLELASLTVFGRTKDFTLPLSADYRILNAEKVRDSWLIQHMDECIKSFGNVTYF